MLREINPKRDKELEPLADPGNVSGFASPAGDYIQDRLHIVQKLVKDPVSTFYFQMESKELESLGISKNALLVVDRSVPPRHGSIIVVNKDGEWIVRQLIILGRQKYLVNGRLQSERTLIDDDGIHIFGVVTWSCNPMLKLIKH
ncbi:S24 family peptidase [Albibacterium indicum]|uniref:S24 family peptidase n=1 Tax=Albibacterium indicum TaxID=2292082 RepID=UPI000E4B1580|nr:S24 family peptidase [Pedobacter indicus]